MQANATKVQKRIRKPRTAAQHAADVIEHVLSTGAVDYLETAEHLYSWWQLALIDVYIATGLIVSAALGFTVIAMWLLFNCCCFMARVIRGVEAKQKSS